MADPRVSAICIFRNSPEFLREALESVIRQDFEDFELLLVDDGSSDSSTAIAREFADARPNKIQYLEHEGHANRGMSVSRNLGARHARGEFIAFIDADDVWKPGKLAEQVGILAAHPEVGMVCGTVNYWSSWDGGADRHVPTGHLRDGPSPPPETALILYPLGVADAPCPSDIMVRRSTFMQVGGFEDCYTGFYEDMAFFAKVFLRSTIWFSSRTWLQYRRHAGSCSSQITPERYRDVRRSFLDWLSAYVEQQPIADKARVNRAIRLARWELDHPLLGRVSRQVRRLALAASR